MKSKIILVKPYLTDNETVVATFATSIEAFMCASLLQAQTNVEGFVYYVEYHTKGKGWRRTQPDSFTSLVNNSVNLQSKLTRVNEKVITTAHQTALAAIEAYVKEANEFYLTGEGKQVCRLTDEL